MRKGVVGKASQPLFPPARSLFDRSRTPPPKELIRLLTLECVADSGGWTPPLPPVRGSFQRIGGKGPRAPGCVPEPLGGPADAARHQHRLSGRRPGGRRFPAHTALGGSEFGGGVSTPLGPTLAQTPQCRLCCGYYKGVNQHSTVGAGAVT